MCKRKLEPLQGELELRHEVKQMEEKLNSLKHVTKVTHIDQIFSW